MEIFKINKKYCTDDKVQVMFSNAPYQIICSVDGYLYFRNAEKIIHRYLDDPIRKKMPYRNKPSSSDHATHLFEYDHLYAKFTRYRAMGGYCMEDSYSLTFLYFVRAENGEALCAEASLYDFQAGEEKSQTFTSEQLKNFLYDIRGVKAKCIFEWFDGMQYVKHCDETFSLKNDGFLDISDTGIIEKYNRQNQPLYLFCDPEERAKKLEDTSWKANTIEDIKDFDLTSTGVISSYSPLMLVIKEDEMLVYEFDVIFSKKNEFIVNFKERKISLNYNDILKRANKCRYTTDPDFKDE